MWLDFATTKNLKLHTYCARVKSRFHRQSSRLLSRTALGCRLLGSRLSPCPTSAPNPSQPPSQPCRLLKEGDNRIRSGSRAKSPHLPYFLGWLEGGKKKRQRERRSWSCVGVVVVVVAGVSGTVSSPVWPFTLCEGRWHLGAARWQDGGGQGATTLSVLRSSLGDPDTVPSVTPHPPSSPPLSLTTTTQHPPVPSGCAYAHHRDADNTGCD